MRSFCVWLLLLCFVIFAQGKSIPIANRRTFGIIGGKYVHINKFPYSVAIYHHKDYEEDVMFGGGAIVNENWIVTSARQFDGWWYQWNPVTVRAGSDSWQSGGQAIVSSKVIFHPDYKSDSENNDISLVKLNSSLVFGKTVKAVQLATAYPPTGCKSFVTGWGVPSMGGGEVTSKQLKAGAVRVKPPAVCQKMYPNMNFTTMHVCADSKNVGPCTFDIGDPLVCKGHLIGFFIGGDICNTWKLIDVYTNVAYHREWILDTISKNSSPQELVRYEQFSAANNQKHDDDDDSDHSDDDDEEEEEEEMEVEGKNEDDDDDSDDSDDSGGRDDNDDDDSDDSSDDVDYDDDK